MARVIVVGAGVMGAAAAWQLAARGADVVLLDQFGPGHDRGSSHGASRIFRLAYPDPFYVDLTTRSLTLWREIERETGRTILTLNGAVDHGPEDVTRQLHAVLSDAGRHSELLAPDEAQARWPGLRFDTSVLFHPDAGRTHAAVAVEAFADAARARGAALRHDVRVAVVHPESDRAVTVVTESGERIVGDSAVLAVGGWAPSLLPDLAPGLPPLRVTQEQPVHFPHTGTPDDWPSFIHHGGAGISADSGVYGLADADGLKVGGHAIGPEVDPDQRDRSIDRAALALIQEYARRWLPGAEADRPQAATCLYTITPDHDFVIDRHGPLTFLAGFSGHGFKFAPLIGALAADLTLEGAPAPSRFALGRVVSPVATS